MPVVVAPGAGENKGEMAALPVCLVLSPLEPLEFQSFELALAEKRVQVAGVAEAVHDIVDYVVLLFG